METSPWSPDARSRDGRFQRKESEFRHFIQDAGKFPAEADRYHLYVSYACPWAHRTLITRALLGLQDAVSFDVVSWKMLDDGSWQFDTAIEGATKDRFLAATSLQEVYKSADRHFSAIGTVPVLWDAKQGTIVNNESREIVRMFDTVLAPALGIETTLCPPELQPDIDAMIDGNYESINNGVYKCGFARTQEAYDENIRVLFDRLEALDQHMADRDWLVGPGRGVLTEADVCLWPTLLRFDVYHTHFKCNKARIKDLPNLWAFVKRFYKLDGVAETVNWDHITHHYYASHSAINPFRIVPIGPDVMAELKR